MREGAGSVPDEAGDSARWAGVSVYLRVRKRDQSVGHTHHIIFILTEGETFFKTGQNLL